MQNHIFRYYSGMKRFTDDYLLYLLAQASGKASAAFHAELATEGVSVSTWRILATLYPDAPASIGQLAESCLAKQPTMTRQVDRLITAGLVVRQQRVDDRRKVEVRLAPAGRKLADRLTAMARMHEARALVGYTKSEISQLKTALIGLLTR